MNCAGLYRDPIRHFRDTRASVSKRVCSNLSYENDFDLQEMTEPVWRTHFRMNDFAKGQLEDGL